MVAPLLLVLMVVAVVAQAAVESRTPLSYGLETWFWVIGISVAGGVASFRRKLQDGSARPFNFMELIGEIFTSGFVGAMTFLICEWSGVNQLLTAAFCGLSGHMGSRAIFLGEILLESYVKERTGLKIEDKRDGGSQ